MAKRLSCGLPSCTRSFVYLEVLLETLVIVLVTTELSLEYINEGQHSSRIDPRARAGFAKALLGIWQEEDVVWTDVIMQPGVPSIFSLAYFLSPPEALYMLSGFASLSFICGTVILHVLYFIFVNGHKWKPALFDVPDQATKALQDTANGLIWQILGLQGFFAVVFIVSHFGWPEIPIFNALFLAIVWYNVFNACKLVCTHISGDGLQTLQDSRMLIHEWNIFRFSAVLSRNGIVYAVSCPLWLLWLFVRMVVSFIVVGILAAMPLVPVVIWSGSIQLIVLLFGKQAAFPAFIVLSISLITYANGRITSFWMTESNVGWIITKLLSALGKASYMHQLFPFERTKSNFKCIVQYQRKEVVSLFLDCMAICVVSCPLWAAYVIGTNIEAYNGASGLLVRSFFGDRLLPESHAPIIAMISHWTNITCPVDAPVNCKEFQAVPVAGIMGTVGMIVSATLAHATLLTLILVMSLGFLFYLARDIKKLCSTADDDKDHKQTLEETSWNRLASIAHLHDCHSAMALVPQFVVKVIFLVYAREFFLTERMFLPGILVWLVWSAIRFYKRLLRKVLAFGKCGIAKVTLDSDRECSCVWVEDLRAARDDERNAKSYRSAPGNNGIENDVGAQLLV